VESFNLGIVKAHSEVTPGLAQGRWIFYYL